MGEVLGSGQAGGRMCVGMMWEIETRRLRKCVRRRWQGMSEEVRNEGKKAGSKEYASDDPTEKPYSPQRLLQQVED